MQASTNVRAPRLFSGLDIASPDSITPGELKAFAEHYSGWKGEQLKGHQFLLEFRPDVLKRYFGVVSAVAGERDEIPMAVSSMGHVNYYAVTGWSDGIRQHMHLQRQSGVRKSEFLDVLAIAALHAGPRGMQWVEEGITSDLREWTEDVAVDASPYPEGWAFDPAAFESGLDFSTEDLADDERASVFTWYEQTLGEVPRSIRFLADDAPGVLKAYRNRFEHALQGGLPKQLMPYCLLQLNLFRGSGEGIRAAAQLGRGFGMTRPQLVGAALHCFFYGGVDTVALLDQHAGDVLASMT